MSDCENFNDSNIIPETTPSNNIDTKDTEKSDDREFLSEGRVILNNETCMKTNIAGESELSSEVITEKIDDNQYSKNIDLHCITKDGDQENLDINSPRTMSQHENDISNCEIFNPNDNYTCTNQEKELKLSVDHNRNIFYDSSINNLSETKANSKLENNDVLSSDPSLNNSIKENETVATEKLLINSSDDCVKPVLNNLKDSETVCDVDKEKAQELHYNNELTESESFVDILGNGLLTKRIITRGLGRETRPTHGDSVTIQYKGWNTNGDVIDDRKVSFVLGDGDMIQAFDLGICLAERHEEFELKTDARFAFGNYGCEPLVQPNEALTYRIKLLQVDDPPEYATFTHQDRLEAADVKRERGNYLYRREEYSLAVNSYSRAIKIIETDPDYKRISTDPSKTDMFDIFVKVTNNLAAAQLKLESYDNVVETCNTILSYDSSNVKALFRKGKSLTMKGNYDEAIPILKRALELENSKLIASELQRCYQLKRAEDEQRARVCRKMFGTGMKETGEKDWTEATASSGWKKIYKYSPYIGAVIITGVSVMLASIAIAKSKGN